MTFDVAWSFNPPAYYFLPKPWNKLKKGWKGREEGREFNEVPQDLPKAYQNLLCIIIIKSENNGKLIQNQGKC